MGSRSSNRQETSIVRASEGAYEGRREFHASWKLGGDGTDSSVVRAMDVVLYWVQSWFGPVPAKGWQARPFSLDMGRGSVKVVTLRKGADETWAIRATFPEFGRQDDLREVDVVLTWSDEAATLAVRASTRKGNSGIPSFVTDLMVEPGLLEGNGPLYGTPFEIEGPGDALELLDVLQDPTRTVPVFVLTAVNERNGPLIDGRALAISVAGLAHVANVSSEASYVLTNRLGKMHTAFNGAVRCYMPGFDKDLSPYDHKLTLADRLSTEGERVTAFEWFVDEAMRNAATMRSRSGPPTFEAIRKASEAEEKTILRKRIASSVGEGDLLSAAISRTRWLEVELARRDEMVALFDSEAKEAIARAETSEAQAKACISRIQALESTARDGYVVLAHLPSNRPTSWDGFAEWCDATLAGRLAMTAPARRACRSPDFADPGQVAWVLEWLATTYRDGRRHGAGAAFVETDFASGMRISHCGGDEFNFDYQGRRMLANLHVKNGNSRDPKRCLRIYFAWDQETEQVVVADLPAHRVSAVS